MSFSHPTRKPLLPGQKISTTGGILAYAAATHPEKTALICGSRSLTYGELDGAANRFANAVLSRVADRDGPVAIIGRNSAEYVIAHFGTARTGRYSVNLQTRCTADDLVHAVNLTRPALVAVDADCRNLVDAARDRFDAPPEQLVIGGAETETDGDFWEFFADQPDTPPDVRVDPDGAGSVIFTGGTTGRPKAVLSSHRARAVSAMAAIEDFRIDPQEIAGFSVPFTHTAGMPESFSIRIPAAAAS